MPPTLVAGNSLKCVYPKSRPFITSEPVDTPGMRGKLIAFACFNKELVQPGLIANEAPALRTFSRSVLFNTVPAPMIADGTSLANRLIASIAAYVRKVISKTLMPPAIKAFAKSIDSDMFSISITGMIGESDIICCGDNN